MKKIKIYNAFVVLATIFALVSCEKDDNDVLETKPDLSTKKTLTDDEMNKLIANGTFTVVQESPKISNEPIVIVPCTDIASKTTDYLKKSNLSKLGLTDQQLVDKYKKSGVTPDGLWFNGDAIKAGRGEFYNTFTDSQKAKFTVNDPVSGTINSTVGGWQQILSTTKTNNSSQTQSETHSYTSTNGQEASWNVGVSANFSYTWGGTVIIPGATTSVSTTISIGATAGYSKTFSQSTTSSVVLPLIVAPYSKSTLQVWKRKINKTRNYSVATSISGYISSNYPRRVDGHYFWSHSASSLFSGKSLTQSGKVVSEYWEYKSTITEVRL